MKLIKSANKLAITAVKGTTAGLTNAFTMAVDITDIGAERTSLLKDINKHECDIQREELAAKKAANKATATERKELYNEIAKLKATRKLAKLKAKATTAN